jgi:hypothetical protein
VFDGVPKTNEIGRNEKMICQEFRASRFNSEMLTSVRDGVLRYVYTLHRMEGIRRRRQT